MTRMETIRARMLAATMAMARSRKICPASSARVMMGVNTTMFVNAEDRMAVHTSLVPS